MTSVLQIWLDQSTCENTRLPADVCELEILCCETESRRVSNTGIELALCVFNSPHLQELRRRLPESQGCLVSLKYNPAKMNRVWVLDPQSNERFEVLNHDPATNDLSAKQVAHLESIRRGLSNAGDVLTRAQARRRMREICEPLVRAARPSVKRQAMRLLGLIGESQMPKSARRPKVTKNTAASVVEVPPSLPALLPMEEIAHAAPAAVPRFTVRRADNASEPKEDVHGN